MSQELPEGLIIPDVCSKPVLEHLKSLHGKDGHASYGWGSGPGNPEYAFVVARGVAAQRLMAYINSGMMSEGIKDRRSSEESTHG